jgi:arylsulfatase A-like enzyme
MWKKHERIKPNVHKTALHCINHDSNFYSNKTIEVLRVAMMTGKYPYRVGRQHMYIKPLMPVGLPVNVNIMPQYFKQAR